MQLLSLLQWTSAMVTRWMSVTSYVYLLHVYSCGPLVSKIHLMLYPYLTLESWFSLYFSLFIPFLLATWQKLIAQHIAPKTCHETKRLWVTAWFVQDVIWNILLTSNKTLWRVHFGVVVVELINCKCQRF